MPCTIQVTRLWFWNTGRFHFIDTLISVSLGLGVALLVGLPERHLRLGERDHRLYRLLTHCNVEMRVRALNYLFNTPGLHRWHHSMVPEEGNRNYGENLMIFDLMFGTFFNRRPPAAARHRHPRRHARNPARPDRLAVPRAPRGARGRGPGNLATPPPRLFSPHETR